jgi:NifU-like protein involved in Fe-S cluster formation
MTVSELLERGLRRNRQAALAVEGAECTDAEGNRARFSVANGGGKVTAVGFCATSCATLIAYSELIAEITPGMGLDLAAGLAARDLIDVLPGVPPPKRERAVLAVAAFRSALASIQAETGEP